MCLIEQGFKLCTCKEKKDNTEAAAIWRLSSYIGLHEPFSVVGEELFYFFTDDEEQNKDYVVHQLNSRNCFDFDFTPNEGDYLEITDAKNLARKYQFIFRNKKWTIDGYDHFTHQTKMYNWGKVKYT